MAPKRLIQPCLPVRLIACIIGCLLTLPAAGTDIPVKSTSDQPPRKVVVGTVMQPFWGKHPGLERRLDQLTVIVDRMQSQSEKKYGRSLDLAVLPEMALSGEGERVGQVADWSFPLEGAVKETFAREARKHYTKAYNGKRKYSPPTATEGRHYRPVTPTQRPNVYSRVGT